MTHMRPMKETEGTFGQFKPRDDVCCPRCHKHDIIMRVWESNCGGFEDLQFICLTKDCGKIWWVDGSDA